MKKDIAYSIAFIVIGILAGILGFVFQFARSIMVGVACGFTPTGIGLLLVYKRAKIIPEMRKNIELENEERNVFINTKAGYTAFWISYWYVFCSVIISNVINVSFKQFSIFTLIFMPVIYFLFVIIYHKKY
ncbi:MAG: hypothetical protein Q8911_10505 [Bacillota bacterium]|nr:hypothetical protein [Bacillota bacterium]